MSELDYTKTNPGMHKTFMIQRFPEREREILRRLKAWWYLTNSGDDVTLGANAKLSYFLMKPITSFAEAFNLEREIICVFSPYPNFEPRTFDAFDVAKERYQELRPEAICRIVVSDDPNVENKVEKLLKSDPEQPIVVPFTYEELLKADEYTIRNRFGRHFYRRNLFNFLSPLRKDLYFFGRSELIQELVNRHLSGEHTGLFGLRKSGKTSIIYATERYLSLTNSNFISLDCESPGIHQLRWFEFLRKLVEEYKASLGSNAKVAALYQYNAKNAADLFSRDMLRIYKSQEEPAASLIIFDEIERISPSTGSSKHWRDESDFIYFWQTLRSFYQRNPDVFTYLMVGTNPSCVEASELNGHENPLFKSVPSRYVPPFEVQQVREMVRKLGRYMGMKFDERIYGLLTEDFGGHPFLIRQFCSEVHEHLRGDRPATVDKPIYESTKSSFNEQAKEYLDMMIMVLRDWYPDEYDMLTFLAQDDDESFAEFAKERQTYTKHLIGYGLIQVSNGNYAFNVEALKTYMSNIHKFERKHLTMEEKLIEVSARRNQVEKAIRKLVRMTLLVLEGESKARKKVIDSLPEPRRQKLEGYSFGELLHRDKSPLFFKELTSIVIREWGSFQNVLDMEKGKFSFIVDDINRLGRPDAHAKDIQPEDFEQLRLHFKRLESLLEQWL